MKILFLVSILLFLGLLSFSQTECKDLVTQKYDKISGRSYYESEDNFQFINKDGGIDTWFIFIENKIRWIMESANPIGISKGNKIIILFDDFSKIELIGEQDSNTDGCILMNLDPLGTTIKTLVNNRINKIRIYTDKGFLDMENGKPSDKDGASILMASLKCISTISADLVTQNEIKGNRPKRTNKN